MIDFCGLNLTYLTLGSGLLERLLKYVIQRNIKIQDKIKTVSVHHLIPVKYLSKNNRKLCFPDFDRMDPLEQMAQHSIELSQKLQLPQVIKLIQHSRGKHASQSGPWVFPGYLSFNQDLRLVQT